MNSKKFYRRTEQRTFIQYLPGAFVYPLRGAGPYVLFFGTLMLIINSFGVSSYLLYFGVVVDGFVALYYFSVITSTTLYKDDPPEWPIANLGDLITASIMSCALSLISFGPLTFYYAWFSMGVESSEMIQKPDNNIILILGIWSAIYFPIGSIAIAETNNLLSLNPLTILYLVLKALIKAPFQYIIISIPIGIILVSQVIICANYFGDMRSMRMPLLIIIIFLQFFSFYFLMVLGRILGLFYRYYFESGN